MAVTTPTNRKELETALRRAFEVDRSLPKVKPKGVFCGLGKMIIIPDDERNCNDVLEDLHFITVTIDDYELWIASNAWMATISGAEHEVVKLRCKGMGWNRIAKVLLRKKLAYSVWDRTTLWRYFCSGLDRIIARIPLLSTDSKCLRGKNS